MSKIEKLAPPGYYVALDEGSGQKDFNWINLICDDGRTFYWSERALKDKDTPGVGWCRLEWMCAPRRKSWQEQYVQYETFEDFACDNPVELVKLGCQPYNGSHWNGGKPPQT